MGVQGGSTPVISIHLPTAASILFASWVEIDAVLSHDVTAITICNSLDQDIRLGLGAAGAEVDYLYLCKGAATGPTVLDRAAIMPKGQRLAIRALVADATTGTVTITLWR